ncbi:rCG32341 [Rattus norvegicus]|uniref:RCG32341 n=1 Tax=Rattus norvegicus TaxID=10116 RepID=A6JWZ8_RAT|nr:rCG32341 [Rattus norvegicus]
MTTHSRLLAMFPVLSTTYPHPLQPRSFMTTSALWKDSFRQSMPSLPPRKLWIAPLGSHSMMTIGLPRSSPLNPLVLPRCG